MQKKYFHNNKYNYESKEKKITTPAQYINQKRIVDINKLCANLKQRTVLPAPPLPVTSISVKRLLSLLLTESTKQLYMFWCTCGKKYRGSDKMESGGIFL